MVTPADIAEASRRIAGRVRVTPVMHLEAGSFGSPGHLVVKLESLQRSGSFKARGAFNRILSGSVPDSGVIAASGGNHGAAVALASTSLGFSAEIYVPEVASPSKVARLRAYGAEVTIIGQRFPQTYQAMQERAAVTGALMVHPYDQPEILAGAGTLGRELEDQVPDVDTVLVAVGGGGLIGGVASWFGGRVRVVGVEPFACATLHDAMQAGMPVDVPTGGIAVDSLGATRIGSLTFDTARQFIDRVVLVEDDAIREAQLLAWDSLRVALEPGGAAALAAVVSGAYVPRAGERVAIVLCGGNLDPASLTPPHPA
ncbi:MAG: threonine/serine dehydratase [Chloroflexi bacterium]|nr:threonine/serine dehydratase [Chloroflexota bacterium]